MSKDKKKLPCGRTVFHSRSKLNTEQRVISLVTRLERFCADQGLKKSNVRKTILEFIVQYFEHFTAQELVTKIHQRHPEIGRATLYRTIPLLVEANVLQVGPQNSEGLPSYELAEAEHHDHIVCLDCGEIVEFSSNQIEAEQDRIAKTLHFRPEHHSHVIYAHCLRLDRIKNLPK